MSRKDRVGRSNAIVDTMIFPVVPIGGAIVHPRLWSLQPTEGNGRESLGRAPPIRVHEVANLTIPTASVHEGLASLWVDPHEVGDLLALTNFLVHSTTRSRRLPSDT